VAKWLKSAVLKRINRFALLAGVLYLEEAIKKMGSPIAVNPALPVPVGLVSAVAASLREANQNRKASPEPQNRSNTSINEPHTNELPYLSSSIFVHPQISALLNSLVY
jgi:hypothetical protein